MKILVVDDQPTDLKLLRSVLSRDGHEVSSAKSGEQAMQLLLELRPHIILTDLSLPGMDGLTMTKKLKQTPATAEIPVIAISAYPDNFTKSAVREAGLLAYFVKPINTRTLSQQVAVALGQSS